MGSLSTASFYQAHLDRKHTLWNIVSTEISIYAPYAGAAGMLLHINGKFTTATMFGRRVVLLTDSRYFLCVPAVSSSPLRVLLFV
jgi:hypothetical protein